MYAIIKDGGKQYTVREGDILLLERKGLQEGEILELTDVLLLSSDKGIRVGEPKLEGVKIVAQVEGEAKGPKITVVKFRRRKSSRTKKGHRQRYTKVKIQKIEEAEHGA
jgi:large subunit ribosomal protein L21